MRKTDLTASTKQLGLLNDSNKKITGIIQYPRLCKSKISAGLIIVYITNYTLIIPLCYYYKVIYIQLRE